MTRAHLAGVNGAPRHIPGAHAAPAAAAGALVVNVATGPGGSQGLGLVWFNSDDAACDAQRMAKEV